MEFSKQINIFFLALICVVTLTSALPTAGLTSEPEPQLKEETKAKDMQEDAVLETTKVPDDDWDMELPVDDNFEAKNDKREVKDLDTAELFWSVPWFKFTWPWANGYYYNNGYNYNYNPWYSQYAYRRWRPSYYYN